MTAPTKCQETPKLYPYDDYVKGMAYGQAHALGVAVWLVEGLKAQEQLDLHDEILSMVKV